MIFIPLVMFALLMLAISYWGIRYYARPARYYEHLGTAVVGRRESTHTGGDNMVVKIVQILGRQVPVSPESVALTRRFLIAAGYASDTAPAVLYGLKVLSAVLVFTLVYALSGYVSMGGVFRLVVVAAAALAGYFLPTLVLEHLVAVRQEDLRLSLPDALDLMVVCVEAGLGLDQAILKVGEELAISHPAISEELGLVTLEMQAGKGRADALRNLADRTGEAEIRKLVAVLIQTDRFGTSMGDSLRTHSDFLRVRRRQEAEERANKIGVKLVFPIFFCILPAMLIVVAGPGLLQIMKYLFPMMRQFSQMNQ